MYSRDSAVNCMKISIGTAQFGFEYGVANNAGQVKPAEVDQILTEAKKNKIDILDTAIAYGKSEESLGKAGVDEFRVITKLPPLTLDQGNTYRWVLDEVEKSLQRLQQKKLYGLLLHHPPDLLGLNAKELIKALTSLKNRGLVQKVGISIYGPDDLSEFFKRAPIDLVQAPLNVVDRRLQASGWLDKLKDHGVEVHTRSTFLQGLLLMDRRDIPQKFSRWSSLWDRWHYNLKELGISPLSACLAYPLSLRQVDQVVVGVDSAVQLLEILKVAKKSTESSDLSFMCSTDLDLINPSQWNTL